MKYETDWQREWDVLRAERETARRRWRLAADSLNARIHDPLGLGKVVRDNPIVSTGIGAVVGALLVKLLVGKPAGAGSGASRSKDSPQPASMWTTVLRDAAISIAVPWLLRMLKEKFGCDLDLGAAAAPEPGLKPADDAESSAVQ